LLVLACLFPGISAAGEFPYSATIESDDAPVHSGPGDEYYATDALPRGAAVEVHRHADGDWLGIRPPEGSFSWVPAEHLAPSDDPAVAVVGPEGAIAWIGARVGRVAQHKWQVKLEPGEAVQIVGDKRHLASMGQRGEGWYKIAPPAGEFRWIHRRHVRLESDSHDGKREAASPGSSAEPRTTRIKLTSLDEPGSDGLQPTKSASPESDHATQRADFQVRPIDHQVALVAADESNEGRTAPSGGDGFVARKKEHDDVSQTRENSTEQVTEPDGSGIDAELRQIELELSTTVARDVAQWELAPVRRQAEQLIERGKTALDRGRARLLLERIAQFEANQQGKVLAGGLTVGSAADELYVPPSVTFAAADPGNPEPGNAGAGVGANPAETSSQHFAQLAQEGRYDGVGWLLPVHSQLQIAPRFALTDDQGRVIQYVVPAPGRNLHRHLRKQVGVIGQKQHVTGLGAPVLTASNVVELERHR
jgi:hypothetical protein